jgi:flagellar motor protein MotB
MNNKIFEIDKDFTDKTFNEFNLDNPIILNQNNYFSKLSHGDTKKTIYLQLPKCVSKNGIVKSNNKSYIELVFNSSEKNIIEFFENLECFLINKIYNNKDLWFYESNNMSYEDIQDLLTPIMRSYKSGKNFIIKANIKNDKFNLYDENEKKVDVDDYNKEFDIIPVINLNGIKLSSKNFLTEIILVQFMIIYPEDIFENNFLINLNKNTLEKKNLDLDLDKASKFTKKEEDKEQEKKKEDEEQEKKKEDEEQKKKEEDEEQKKKEEDEEQKKKEEDEEQKKKEEDEEQEKKEEDKEQEKKKEDEEENNKFVNKDSKRDLLLEKTNNNNLNLVGCDEVDIMINEKDHMIELTNHETIYLEIYKKARKKAKEIKKNAIKAFIEAKNIKAQYNLDYNDSSSDEENEEFF